MKISGLSLKPKPGKAPLRSILFDNNGNDDNSSLEALLNRIKYSKYCFIGILMTSCVCLFYIYLCL